MNNITTSNNNNNEKKKPVVVCNWIPEPTDEKLGKLTKYFDMKFFDGLRDSNREEFMKELEYAEGLIVYFLRVDRELIKNAKNLKVVSLSSSGFDLVDVKYLNERKIQLMNTPKVLADTCADTIMGLVLNTVRRFNWSCEEMKAGKWVSKKVWGEFRGKDVHHRTMGIVGMGNIGKVLCKRAHFGFDMPILYSSRSRQVDVEEKYSAKYCQDLDTLLAEADIVVVILPLNDDTYHRFSTKQFSLMKKTSYFINFGRGKVVDEIALIKALQDKVIAGAGLDVYEIEPLPMDSPLFKLDNVTLFPHLGSSTNEAQYGMRLNSVDNLIAGLHYGDFSNNLVNPNFELK
eukprot:gene4835-6025_t